jgi:multidrug efflux pump subunit AcrA (membrane-fusion protein)
MKYSRHHQSHYGQSCYGPGRARSERIFSRLIWPCGLLAALFLSSADCGGQGLEAADTGDSIVVQSALLRVIEQASTPARATGVLALIQVREGDVVEEGALLAKVDDTEAEWLYQRAVIEHELASQRTASDVAIRSRQKTVDFSRQEYLRLKRAADEIPGSISKSELEQGQLTAAQAALDLEQAQQDQRLDILTERLKRTEKAIALRNQEIHQILAPVKGMVVEVLRHRGEWVEPGENVLRIMRIDRLRAEGLVAVQDVMLDLKEANAEITVSVPGRPDVTVSGQVVFVSPEINPVNGQVRVRAEFDNPDGWLMPGMRAAIHIHPRQVAAASPAAAAVGHADPDSP